MGLIIFNGLCSEDYGIKVWQPPNYVYPERDYDIVHVPGRSGDLLIDKGSYRNVIRSYVVSFGDAYNHDYTLYANGLSEWLHSCSGYSRLEDSYEPEYYRIASYMESAEIVNAYHKAGQVTINFNCKPQRFLKIGDDPIVITGGNGKVENPTMFSSKPLIKVIFTGVKNGQLTFNNGDVIIIISGLANNTNYIMIDCDLMDCYDDSGRNVNSNVILAYNKFPTFGKGVTNIDYIGGIDHLEVIPRWWTL